MLGRMFVDQVKGLGATELPEDVQCVICELFNRVGQGLALLREAVYENACRPQICRGDSGNG